MAHFVVARHTFLCIVTARHGNITIHVFAYHVLFICYFCNAAMVVAAQWRRRQQGGGCGNSAAAALAQRRR
jgi:hypothetical protein